MKTAPHNCKNILYDIQKGIQMDIGIPELLTILVVVLLIFGPGRIARIAGELGASIRHFRQGFDSPAKPEADEKPIDD